MSFASGKVRIEVVPVKKSLGAAIVVGVPFSGCGQVLHSLSVGCTGAGISGGDGVDAACVANAVFDNIRTAIQGNAAAMLTRDVDCHAAIQSGEFCVYVKCPNQIAVIKKCIAVTIKGMSSSAKTFAKYSTNVRSLGAKPDRDAFDAAVHAMNAGLAKGVKCVVSGKVNPDKKDLWKKVVEVADSALSVDSKGPSGKKRHVVLAAESDHSALKSSEPLARVMVGRYIEASLKCGLVYANGSIWHAKSLTNKIAVLNDGDRIARFVAPTDKLGDELTGALIHESIQACSVSAAEVSKVEKMTPKKLEAAIKKALS